jgi:hypothetical protein
VAKQLATSYIGGQLEIAVLDYLCQGNRSTKPSAWIADYDFILGDIHRSS